MCRSISSHILEHLAGDHVSTTQEVGALYHHNISSQHLAGDHVSTTQEVCALYYHHNISQETMYHVSTTQEVVIILSSQEVALYTWSAGDVSTMYALYCHPTSRRRPCINIIILSSQHLAGDHVSTTQEVGALYYHHNICRRHVSTTQEVGASQQETMYQLLKK